MPSAKNSFSGIGAHVRERQHCHRRETDHAGIGRGRGRSRSRRHRPAAVGGPGRSNGSGRLGIARLRELVPETREIVGQVPRRRIALFRVLRETPLDDPAKLHRRPRRDAIDRFRLLTNDGRHRLRGACPGERPRTRQHLVQHRAEGELVRTEVDRSAESLFGRHVGGRPHHHPGFRRLRDSRRHRLVTGIRLGDQLPQAEVKDLREAVGRDDHVLGLQVPVHDPRAVRLRETVGNLGRDREDSLRRQSTLGQQLPNRPPFHQLHRDVGGFPRLSDVVDRDDAGVVQRRDELRLLLEALQPLRVP